MAPLSSTQRRTINMAGQIVLQEEENDDDSNSSQHSPLTLPSTTRTSVIDRTINNGAGSPLLPTSNSDILQSNELAPGWVWGFGTFRNQTARSEKLQRMWLNHKEKKKHNNRSANVKTFRGRTRFSPLTADIDEVENNHLSDEMLEFGSGSNHREQVSVLVEIPEEMEGLTSRKSAENKNDSAAIDEICKNLNDMDNYMLSVFHMNDDASVCQSAYTMATADTSFSSSSSAASSVSTRKRHRGAFRNRRRDSLRSNGSMQSQQQRQKASNWLESMKESSKNIFVDGGDSWTPSKGWHVAAKKTLWDSKPDGRWDDANPFFDAI